MKTKNYKLTDSALKEYNYIVFPDLRDENAYAVVCDSTKHKLTKDMAPWTFLHNNGFIGSVKREMFDPNTILPSKPLGVIAIAGAKRSGKSIFHKKSKKSLRSKARA